MIQAQVSILLRLKWFRRNKAEPLERQRIVTQKSRLARVRLLLYSTGWCNRVGCQPEREATLILVSHRLKHRLLHGQDRS